MSDALVVALWFALIPIAVCAAYLAMLALLALTPATRPPRNASPRRSFLVLIPAHNEEALIGRTLESVQQLTYPSGLVTTVVVADNCEDATAQVARASGVKVLERHEADRLGKGFALVYGLAHTNLDVDAVVFLDADCTVSPNLLSEFSAWIDAGARVIQARYNISTGGQSTLLLRSLALTLVHTVRGRGKARIGWSAGLKGSGMCFDRALVAELGWSSHGLAEDAEQHVELLLAGMRVTYADEASVIGLSPTGLGAATNQHARWEAGRLAVARASCGKLLRASVGRESPALLVEALELAMPPLSVLGILVGFACLAAWILGGGALLSVAVLSVLGLTIYVGSGFVFLRMSAGDALRCIAAVPAFALWKTFILVRAQVRAPGRWEPTRRSGGS